MTARQAIAFEERVSPRKFRLVGVLGEIFH